MSNLAFARSQREKVVCCAGVWDWNGIFGEIVGRGCETILQMSGIMTKASGAKMGQVKCIGRQRAKGEAVALGQRVVWTLERLLDSMAADEVDCQHDSSNRV